MPFCSGALNGVRSIGKSEQIKDLYRIGRADNIATDSARVLCFQTYGENQESGENHKTMHNAQHEITLHLIFAVFVLFCFCFLGFQIFRGKYFHHKNVILYELHNQYTSSLKLNKYV